MNLDSCCCLQSCRRTQSSAQSQPHDPFRIGPAPIHSLVYFAQVITSQARQFAPCTRRRQSLSFVLQSSNRFQQASVNLAKGPLLRTADMLGCSAANLLSCLRFLPDRTIYFRISSHFQSVCCTHFANPKQQMQVLCSRRVKNVVWFLSPAPHHSW